MPFVFGNDDQCMLVARIDKVLATPILPGEDADEEDPDVEHDGHSSSIIMPESAW